MILAGLFCSGRIGGSAVVGVGAVLVHGRGAVVRGLRVGVSDARVPQRVGR
jgi:hypothetical protein